MRSHSNWRSLLVGTAVLATVALVTTGCGRSEEEPGDAAATTVDDSPATGTVELWAEGPDGAELPTMFEKFKEDNPDVDIRLTEVPSDEFGSKMTAAITAGTVPDLVYSYVETAPGILSTDGFDPVPDGLVDADAFFPAILEGGTYQGTQYGVPWYAYASTTILRSDLAEQAGAEIPTDWDSLRTYAEKLKAFGVEVPLCLIVTYDQYTANQFLVFSAQNGGSLISEDASTWTINAPENVEALEFWQSLIEDGLGSADSPLYLDTVPWISQGRSATIIDGGPWFANWFDDANGDGWTAEHLAFTPTMTGPSGDQAAPSGGANWFVPTDAKNKDAAWKFARFMAEPDSQVDWYNIFGNLPALRAAWDDLPVQDSPVLTAVRDSMEIAVGRPTVPTWTQVGDAIGQQMERVARGEATAQEALDAAQQQAESIGTGD